MVALGWVWVGGGRAVGGGRWEGEGWAQGFATVISSDAASSSERDGGSRQNGAGQRLCLCFAVPGQRRQLVKQAAAARGGRGVCVGVCV